MASEDSSPRMVVVQLPVEIPFVPARTSARGRYENENVIKTGTHISLESFGVVDAEEEDDVARVLVSLREKFLILNLSRPGAFIQSSLYILMVPRFDHEISASTSLKIKT
jgi:hypothetical protein